MVNDVRYYIFIKLSLFFESTCTRDIIVKLKTYLLKLQTVYDSMKNELYFPEIFSYGVDKIDF